MITGWLVTLRRHYKVADMRAALRVWVRRRGEPVVEEAAVRRVIALVDPGYCQPSLAALRRWLYDSLLDDRHPEVEPLTPAGPAGINWAAAMNAVDAHAAAVNGPRCVNITRLITDFDDAVGGEIELARLTLPIGERRGGVEVFVVADESPSAFTDFSRAS